MPRRATKKQIAITIALLIAVGAAGFWRAPHIYWSYFVSRNKIKLAPVKVTEMPPAQPQTDWYTCRAGRLTFQLPPGMAEEAERAVAKTAHQSLTLTAPTHELTLTIPAEIPASRRPVIDHIAARYQVSPMQFIEESYRTGTDDFRWTMSNAELARHKLLLELSAQFYPHAHIKVVETWSDAALEGMLVLHDSRSLAMYEWRLKSGKSFGVLRFSVPKGELNPDDLRAVCQSLTCDESQLGPELSKDQLAVLADTMKIELDALPVKAGESVK